MAEITVEGIAGPALREIRQQADAEVRDLCRSCLLDLDRLGGLGAGRDPDVETERLWALLDGLTLHILLPQVPPEPAAVTAVLRRHLADLGDPIGHPGRPG